MTHFELYVINEDGNSASWSHTVNGNRGLLPCLHFPDNKDCVIMLEHPTMTTMMFISAEGELKIVHEKKPKPEPPPPEPVVRRRRRRRRRV